MTTQVIGRMIYATECEYLYTLEENLQDFGGTGQRRLIIEVQTRLKDGQLGEKSRIQLYNPPPDMSGVVVGATPKPKAVFLDWSLYAARALDLSQYKILYATETEAITGGWPLVFVGTRTFTREAPSNNVLIPDLTPGVLYYFQVWPFDSYGVGFPAPVVSATGRGIDQWRSTPKGWRG